MRTGTIYTDAAPASAFQAPTRESWMDKANCLGVAYEEFEKTPNAEDPPGKEYCEPCEVKNECLIFHLLKEDPKKRRYGYAGNMGPAARTKKYKQLKEIGLLP
jgi:hypothetical protein